MSLRRQLLAEWDRDVLAGAEDLFDTYVGLVQDDPVTPRDTGNLSDGIRRVANLQSEGRLSTIVNSTARSARGADYGTILDRSTGRVVKASRYGKTAFGPIRPPLGGNRSFIRQFRVTTRHVGWWDEVNPRRRFEVDAARVLDRYGL